MTAQTAEPAERRARDVVAGNVRGELAKRRLTRGELADLTGWSVRQVQLRLDAEVPFDVDEVTLLARVLELDVAALFAGAS